MPGLYDASKPQASFLETWFLYRAAVAASDDLNNPAAVTALLDLSKSFKGLGNSIRLTPRRVSGTGTVDLILVRENSGSLAGSEPYTTIATNSAVATLVESAFSDLIAGKYRVLMALSASSVWELHAATSVAGSSVAAVTSIVRSQDLSLSWLPASVNLGESLLYSCSVANSIPGITDLVFSQFSFVAGGGISFDNAQDVTSLSFPNLVDVPATAFFVFKDSPLIHLSLPNFKPGNGLAIDLSGNALDVSSVNALLVQCAANVAFASGSVDISGGTSAAPTGAGAAAVVTLTGRSVTVTTN